MMEYFLAPAAERDLDERWEYIAIENLDAADRWIEKIHDAFEMLSAMPGAGHARKELTPLPILFWPVGACLVVYRVQREQVEIVAVMHGAQDIPMFLHRRGL